MRGAAGARRRRASSRRRSGPGAGGCCYEVGDEVARALPGRPAARATARSTSRPSRRARLRAAGVAEVHDVGRCTICEPDVFFSHRARRRRHRPPGRARVAQLIAGLTVARRARQPRARARRDRRRRRARGAHRRRRRRSWRRSSTCALDELPRPGRRPGIALVGREPRPGPRGQGRRARRRALHLGLHRPPAEPQGQADPAARAADPLGRQRLGARRSWRATRPAARPPRSWSRSTSPARRARAAIAPGRAGRVPRALPEVAGVEVVGLMTMPPLAAEARGQPPLVRRAGRAGGRRTACPSCRWARPRTSPSPSRRARRSCASARGCTV